MSNRREQQTIAGLATARGLAVGPAFVYGGEGELSIPEYALESGSEEAEVLRFMRALVDIRRDLENLIAALKERTGKEDVKVFECHLMFAEDPLLVKGVQDLIRTRRLNAAAAVRKTVDGFRGMFARMNDPYFRERVRDLDDVERRLLKTLAVMSGDSALKLPSPVIVVAGELTPSELMRLPRERLLGLATDGGSRTSHVALLARAMGVPYASGLVQATARVQAGDTVLLDGGRGTLTVNPTPDAERSFREELARQSACAAVKLPAAPAGTLKDGGEIVIQANLQPGMPVDGIREAGARGVGLYRSEFLWLDRELEPTEEEQYAAYRDAARFVKTLGKGATATIRVLDIGGDKLVRGISTKEANPFLGNRSIRYLLANERIFRTQLRAILRASAEGGVRLLYPMISWVEELRRCAEILAEVKGELEREGVAFDRALPVGAMIEVPAAAIGARALAEYVDFFSIGTNDLVQYLMAADRGNEAVARLYQPTNPAVLRVMQGVIDAAQAAAIEVGVCGESAADPVVGVLWAAMGVSTLSMSATCIPTIARVLAELTRTELKEYLQVARSLGDGATGGEVYAACRRYLEGKIPNFDAL